MTLDLVIQGGRVIDGTGNPWYWADLGLAGGKIVQMGDLRDASATTVIDATGLVVAPGFIDLHSHADFVLPLAEQAAILEPFVRQGITTVVVGNCGLSPAPVAPESLNLLKGYSRFLQAGELAWDWLSLGEYLDVLDRQGVCMNVAPLVAHGAVRLAVLGFENRAPNRDEMSRMRRLVRESMEQGAFGLSAGLIYPPGMFAVTDELADLAGIAAEHDGLFACHIRGSSETLLPAVRELVEIGRRSGCRVQHSHIEAFGRQHWDKLPQVLDLHDEARLEGIDLGLDVIPHVAANTTLAACFPPWALEQGCAGLVELLNERSSRARVRHDIENTAPEWPPWGERAWPHNLVRATGWGNIVVIWVESERNKPLEGKSIAEIAHERSREPFDVAAGLMSEEQGRVAALFFGVSGDKQTDEPLLTLLAHPRAAFNTDAILTGKGVPHPAAYGAYPRVLGHYVRDRMLLPLEDAIRRMTSLSAQRLGITDRGLLRKGMCADVTIFDAARINDNATYENPRQFPDGVHTVIVNGCPLFADGVYYAEHEPGAVIRRN